MHLLLAFLGALAGLALGASGGALLGALAGAVVSVLMARQNDLSNRLRNAERTIEEIRFGMQVRATERPEHMRTTERREDDLRTDTAAQEAPTTPESAPEPAPAQVAPAAARRGASEPAAGIRSGDVGETQTNFVGRFLTTGNVAAKVGVIVLFFGVAFLLKYAVDNRLLSLPIELRYLAVAAAGAALAGFGWRLRHSHRTYALIVQGGGVGILYLTTFAAFRLHPLLPGWFAFVLLAALSLATGYLAARQDAMPLALYGVVGGFLAPILASTGSGSHVGLFGYYLFLNLAILYLSLRKSWRPLNLAGFVFTFLISLYWGASFYRPSNFASTEPFLIANFLLYVAVAVLFALRQPPNLRGLVDGTLVFGTPVATFALQSALLDGEQTPLAISAAVLSGFYFGLARWLSRLADPQLGLLRQAFAGIAISFAALTVPLALDGPWIGFAWSLQGAALVWLGTRQQQTLAWLGGSGLLGLSGLVLLFEHWDNPGSLPLISVHALTLLLAALLSIASAGVLDREEDHARRAPFAMGLLILGAIEWLAFGYLETDRHAGPLAAHHWNAVWLMIGAVGLSVVAQRIGWRRAGLVALGYLPLLGLLIASALFSHQHVVEGWGWLLWPMAFAAHLVVLWLARHLAGAPMPAWHAIGALMFAVGLSIECAWQIYNSGGARVWQFVVGQVVWLGAAAKLLLVPRLTRIFESEAVQRAYIETGFIALLVFFVVHLGGTLQSNGAPVPWPYLPALNPFDLLAAAGLALAWFASRPPRGPAWLNPSDSIVLVGAAGFVLSTAAVLRAVTWYAGIDWSFPDIAGSITTQAALSVYWSVLALTGMTLGARRAERPVWTAGAALMGLVVAKLFLVDLGSSGTVARIVSFLGVGVTLLAVGYFAPAPARRAETTSE